MPVNFAFELNERMTVLDTSVQLWQIAAKSERPNPLSQVALEWSNCMLSIKENKLWHAGQNLPRHERLNTFLTVPEDGKVRPKRSTMAQ